MKVCYFTAGTVQWASSRMRAYWPAEYMDAVALPLREVDEAVQRMGVSAVPDADVYVFQKLYSQRVRDALPITRLAVWDVCDPLWWFDPEGSHDVLDNVDAVTVSSVGLADDLTQWLDNRRPVYYVPDCIEPSHFPIQAVHSDHEPIRFIWYGISSNRVALHAVQANLERLVANGYRIELTIMDERPDMARVFMTDVVFPVYFVRWSLEQENEVIAAHDIALLPPYPGPWGKVKSNNKVLTAWACNVPSTAGLDYSLLTTLVESANGRKRHMPIWLSYDATAANIAREWEQTFRFIQDDLSSPQRESAVFAEDTAALSPA